VELVAARSLIDRDSARISIRINFLRLSVVTTGGLVRND
jgi:hypothetical protein